MALTVEMSEAVERALGAQMALQARGITDGSCIECEQPLDGPVNVVLGKSSVEGVAGGAVWYAHDRCSPSRIVPLGTEATDTVLRPEDGLDMAMTAALFNEQQPALIAEMSMTALTDSGTPGAEPRNVFLESMLQSGFGLITTDPATEAGPLPGWLAVLQPHGRHLRLIVMNPAGEVFYRGGLAAPPDGWVRAVLAHRQVLLLGTGRPCPLGTEPDHRPEALAVAARAGQLVGARIGCGRLSDVT